MSKNLVINDLIIRGMNQEKPSASSFLQTDSEEPVGDGPAVVFYSDKFSKNVDFIGTGNTGYIIEIDLTQLLDMAEQKELPINITFGTEVMTGRLRQEDKPCIDFDPMGNYSYPYRDDAVYMNLRIKCVILKGA